MRRDLDSSGGLAGLDPSRAGMRTVVIVGSSQTTRIGDWLVTARSLAVT